MIDLWRIMWHNYFKLYQINAALVSTRDFQNIEKCLTHHKLYCNNTVSTPNMNTIKDMPSNQTCHLNILLSLTAIRQNDLTCDQWVEEIRNPSNAVYSEKCFASAKRIRSGCTENRLCVHEFWNGQTGEIALIHIHKEKCSTGITAVSGQTQP